MKLETDDVNDGFFHRGKIPINKIHNTIIDLLDRRALQDLLEGEEHWK